MKGASSAQMLRHGVFAVAVGVVGAAASVALCLVVGWAYDLVCAHDWLLYLLPIFAVASLLLYRALKLPLDTTTHTVINDICADRPISPALAPGILLGTLPKEPVVYIERPCCFFKIPCCFTGKVLLFFENNRIFFTCI